MKTMTRKQQQLAVPLRTYKWLRTLRILASYRDIKAGNKTSPKHGLRTTAFIQNNVKSQPLSYEDSVDLRSGLLVCKILKDIPVFLGYKPEKVSTKLKSLVQIDTSQGSEELLATVGSREAIWQLIYEALSCFTLLSSSNVKQKIVQISKEDDDALMQFLHELQLIHLVCDEGYSTQKKIQDRTAPIDKSSVVAVSINEDDLERIMNSTRLNLQETSSLGEFFLVSLIKNFNINLQLEQMAALLGSSSHLLKRICTHGIKNSFENVLDWVELLQQNLEKLAELMLQGFEDDVIGVLRLLRLLLISESKRVALLGCKLLDQLFRILHNTHHSEILFAWMSRQTLHILTECWEVHKESRHHLSSIISCVCIKAFHFEKFHDTVSKKLKGALPHVVSYISFLHEFVLAFKNGKDEFVNHNLLARSEIPVCFVEIGLSFTETHYDPTVRQSALGFVSEVWQSYQSSMESITENFAKDILFAFNKAARASNKSLQLFALSSMFELLQSFAANQNLMAPLLYKTLIFLFIELHGNSEVREIIISNLISSLEEIPYAPIGILISPLIKQITLYGFNNIDIDLLFTLAKHQNLMLENGGTILLSLCGRITLCDPIFGKAASNCFLYLLERFISSEPVVLSCVYEFIRAAISALSTVDSIVPKISKLNILSAVICIVKLRNKDINTMIAPLLRQSIILEPLAELCGNLVQVRIAQKNDQMPEHKYHDRHQEFHHPTPERKTVDLNSYPSRLHQQEKSEEDQHNPDGHFVMDNNLDERTRSEDNGFTENAHGKPYNKDINVRIPNPEPILKQGPLSPNKKHQLLPGNRHRYRVPEKEHFTMKKLRSVFESLDIHNRGFLYKVDFLKAINGGSTTVYQILATCPISSILLETNCQAELRHLRTQNPGQITFQEAKEFCIFKVKEDKILYINEDPQRRKRRKFLNVNTTLQQFQNIPVPKKVQQSIYQARDRYVHREAKLQEEERKRERRTQERIAMRNRFIKRMNLRKAKTKEQEIGNSVYDPAVTKEDHTEESAPFLDHQKKTIFYSMSEYIEALEENESLFQALFVTYRKLSVQHDQGFDDISKQIKEIKLAQWLRFTREFDMVPTLLSQVESASVFHRVLSGRQRRKGTHMQYDDFLIAVAYCLDNISSFQCFENVQQCVTALISHFIKAVKTKKKAKGKNSSKMHEVETELMKLSKTQVVPSLRHAIPGSLSTAKGIKESSVAAMEIIDELLSEALGIHMLMRIPIAEDPENLELAQCASKAEKPFVPTEPKEFKAGRISDAVASRFVEKAWLRKEKEETEKERQRKKQELDRQARDAQLKKDLVKIRQTREKQRKEKEERIRVETEKKQEEERKKNEAERKRRKEKKQKLQNYLLEQKHEQNKDEGCEKKTANGDASRLQQKSEKVVKKSEQQNTDDIDKAEKLFSREIAGALVKKQIELEMEQKRLKVVMKEKRLKARQREKKEEALRKIIKRKELEEYRRGLVEKRRQEESEKAERRRNQIEIEAKQKFEIAENLLKQRRTEEEEKKKRMIKRTQIIEKAVKEFEEEKTSEIKQLRGKVIALDSESKETVELQKSISKTKHNRAEAKLIKIKSEIEHSKTESEKAEAKDDNDINSTTPNNDTDTNHSEKSKKAVDNNERSQEPIGV